MIKKTPLLIAAIAIILAGCSKKPAGPDFPDGGNRPDGQPLTPIEKREVNDKDAVDLSSFDFTLSGRDSNDNYDQNSPIITFNGSKVTATGNDVAISGSTVTIKKAGTFIITGNGQGQIIVNTTDDNAKVQLVLDNLTLENKEDSAIIIINADKVIITLPIDSINTVSDGSSYNTIYDNSTVDAAIFSKEDLTINGNGTLNVNGNYAHGIVSKDDLVIYGSKLNITSVKDGLQGKDSISLVSANLTIKAGDDGLDSDNDTKEGKGYVYIENSEVSIEAAGKGLKAARLLNQMSGNLIITAEDDAINVNNTILINGGSVTTTTSDDGIHADVALTINDGNINILKSYEGLEGKVVTINGGNITVKASDDGINAASKTARKNNFAKGFDAEEDAYIIFNGGYTVVDANGDGIDSNGYIIVNDGILLVSGPTNSGNASIDHGISTSVNGGYLLATGSSGMVERIATNKQGVIITDLANQKGSETISLTDDKGNVTISFKPTKTYNNVIISAPTIAQNKTYHLVSGDITGADSNGFAKEGTVQNKTDLLEIKMSSLLYYNTKGWGQGGGRGNNTPDGKGGKRNPGNQSKPSEQPADI